MPRTKQTMKRRSKPHRKAVLKLRKRKNRKKATRRSHMTRARRRSGGKKK